MFKIISGKGFHITFKNGVTVSVQFGWGNYCDKYPNNKDMFTENLEYIKDWKDPLPREGSPNAEVAIWDKNDKWITKEYIKSINEEAYDDVIGFQTPEQVLDILNWAKNYKNYERIEKELSK